jgi:DNA primase
VKPDLLKVLQHYGVDVKEYRVSQLVRCFAPDHDDTKASLSVDLTKGLVNCMACEMRGDVYSIVEKMEGLTHGAARQRAATIAGSPPELPIGGSRPGLSGGSRPGRRGWQPRTRRSRLKPHEA